MLLYELLAGRHPTASPQSSPAEALRATLDVDPDRLSTAVAVTGDRPAELLGRIAQARKTSPGRLRRQLGGDLENIVAKSLRKAPAERYPTVDAFADDLRRREAGEPVTARPDSVAYRARRFVGRHRGAVAATAFTFLAIVGGLVGTVTQARRAEQESARAAREAAQAKLERDHAVVDGQLQRGTNEFLQLVLRDSAGSDPGAIRRQLDRAGELIDRTRFEQPIVKVALLRQTAGRYAELGDIAAARTLLERAIAATAGTDLVLPTSGVPVNLACSHARHLHEMDEQLAALAELDRADRLIAAGADVGVPSRVACMQSRAYAESALGHHDRAVSIGRDALKQLEAAGIGSGEQHRLMRSVLSQTLAAAGRYAEAMAIAQPLLAESTAAQGRGSIAVLRRSSVVTALTRLGGNPLAALALSQADRDDAARVLGPAREDAAFALEHGRILLALGRDAEAAKMLARAAEESRRSSRLGLTRSAGIAEADALAEAGDLRGAAAVWAGLAPLRSKAAAEGRPVEIDLLLESRLAAARGDARAVLAPLEAAQKRIDSTGGAANPMAFAVALARGEAMLASAAPPSAALAVAQQALAAARAQVRDDRAGKLTVHGARGGPQFLQDQAGYFGINDTLAGDYRTHANFTPEAMDSYAAWAKYIPDARRADREDRDRDVAVARRAIARGEALFNEKPIAITGVKGLNDALHAPLIMGTCTTCHDAPNAGSHSVPLPLDIGIADASRRIAGMPLYTLRNKTTGEQVQTTDPGRALVTGLWADVGKFKGPTLRALAARAPYFHDGFAKDLDEVVQFYDTRFNVGLTKQEMDDIVAFLEAL